MNFKGSLTANIEIEISPNLRLKNLDKL